MLILSIYAIILMEGKKGKVAGFIHSELLPGENLIYMAETSKLSFMPYIIWMFLAITFMIVFTFATESWSSILFYIVLIIVIICLIAMVFRYIKNLATEFGFTNKRILGETGFMNPIRMDSQFDRIRNVTVTFDSLGSFFDYGDVVISTAGKDYIFTAIKSPGEFKSALINQIEDNANKKKVVDSTLNAKSKI